jgi:CTP:molybdopterin cytidylyltransferase MocA
VSAALILAAGGGTRFGEEPKLLGDVDGMPVLERVVRNASDVPHIQQVVVVLGAHSGVIRERVDFGDARVVVCERWADGQSASLRCGLEALGDVARKVVVLLGDQPLVTPRAIEWLACEPAGSRASYQGRPGHPVVLGPRLVEEAKALEGDRGLRDLVRWRMVEVGHLASDRDVDTPDDLEKIRDEARAVL